MQTQQILLKVKAVSAGAFERPAALLKFVAIALVAPFILLTIGGSQANNLPWYFWAAMITLLVTVISIGYVRFARGSNDGEDISINPDRG